MQLIFLRHGPAGSRAEWQGPDAERPLTDEGRAVVRGSPPCWPARASRPTPCSRARSCAAAQTAEIAAEALGCAERLADDERLARGFDRTRLAGVVAEHPAARVLMLVGHEPDFSATIAQLTGGTVAVKKAGVARVDLDEQTMRGTLVWLLPPRVFSSER